MAMEVLESVDEDELRLFLEDAEVALEEEDGEGGDVEAPEGDVQVPERNDVDAAGRLGPREMRTRIKKEPVEEEIKVEIKEEGM
ncbi:hypothetical protein BJ508DRAFT_414114, partial [Ascobolus immersus RN42]